jgi:hypothetical protein
MYNSRALCDYYSINKGRWERMGKEIALFMDSGNSFALPPAANFFSGKKFDKKPF